MGTYLGMRAVIEPMRRAGGGAIVNIASGLAFTSLPGFFPYGASKWAVRGMTRLAARDLAEFRIRVVTVTPGAIETPMLEPSVRANQATMMPLGRVGTCEEFARVVLFVVSDSAAYVSGAEIMVDGALLS
jgi:3alpha(or 20beta)-hydroxysteroid dehydrogenase